MILYIKEDLLPTSKSLDIDLSLWRFISVLRQSILYIIMKISHPKNTTARRKHTIESNDEIANDAFKNCNYKN